MGPLQAQALPHLRCCFWFFFVFFLLCFLWGAGCTTHHWCFWLLFLFFFCLFLCFVWYGTVTSESCTTPLVLFVEFFLFVVFFLTVFATLCAWTSPIPRVLWLPFSVFHFCFLCMGSGCFLLLLFLLRTFTLDAPNAYGQPPISAFNHPSTLNL